MRRSRCLKLYLPDSCALLPTVPSSVDLSTLTSTVEPAPPNSKVLSESVVVFGCAKVYYDVITKRLTLVT